MLTREEAIQGMRDHARALVDPAYMDELLAPFGESCKKLEIAVKPTKDFHRVMTSGENAELESVAVYRAAVALALALAPAAQHAAWKQRLDKAGQSAGMGAYAEEKALAACDLLDEWCRLFREGI